MNSTSASTSNPTYPPFPLIFPASTSSTHWFGSIQFPDSIQSDYSSHRISIEQTSSQPALFRLHLSPFLTRLFAEPGIRNILLKRFLHVKSSNQAVIELVDIANRAFQQHLQQQNQPNRKNPRGIGEELQLFSFSSTAANATASLPNSVFYSRLLSELKEFPSSIVQFNSPTMQRLILSYTDRNQRIHQLNIRIPTDWPNGGFLENSSDLPCELSQHHRVLMDCYRNFQRAVDEFQIFFNEIDEFDRECWILEPEIPRRAITSRRLAIARGCSLIVQIDPTRPLAVPELQFLGSENSVQAMRIKWNSSSMEWKSGDQYDQSYSHSQSHSRSYSQSHPRSASSSSPLSVRLQLQELLEIEFPRKELTNEMKSIYDIECSICYSYQFNNEFPVIACENSLCTKMFHRQCILEWFHTIPSANNNSSASASSSSGEIHQGECLFCQSLIIVK